MATTTKPKTKSTARKTTTPKKTTTAKPVVETIVVEKPVVVEEVSEPASRRYEAGDMIACRSVKNGVVRYVGKKTGDLYEWSGYGDVTNVAYGDLLSLKASKSGFLYKPWIIIMDEDAIEQLNLTDLYSTFVEYEDVEEFLELPSDKFRIKLMNAPDGFKDTTARTAAAQIRSGQLDSVIKIKIIDDVLGTSLMSMLNNGGF